MTYLDAIGEMLLSAVGDGGAIAREKVEAEARRSDELEVTFGCYCALAAWGVCGLERIVQIALEGQSVRSKSAALTLLASIAVTGRAPDSGPLTFLCSRLSDLVSRKTDPQVLRSAAKRALRRLILSTPTDDLLIPLSQSMIHMHMAEAELIAELVSALSTKWLRFGPSALERFEALLQNERENEGIFQEFFCDHPQILDPMAMQVWSRPDFHGALEPDFVVRRADDSYLVVEIECPSKPIMAGATRFSHQAAHAEAQAIEYEDFLSLHITEATTHFPSYRRADCLAVIGLEKDLTRPQRQALDRLNGRRQNSKVVGFDWLLERARTLISNIGDGRIEVTRGLRIV